MKKLIAMILALAAVFSLTACAGQEEYDDLGRSDDGKIRLEATDPKNNNTEITDPEINNPEVIIPETLAEPTEEEQNILLDYQNAVNEVTAYHNGESSTISWSNDGYHTETHYAYDPNYVVLKTVYEVISGSADVVDKFKDSNFAQSLNTNWNYEEVLGWFTVIEDVPVGGSSVKYNAVGVIESSDVDYVFHYDENGNVLPNKWSSDLQVAMGLPVHKHHTTYYLSDSYTCEYENGVVTKVTHNYGNRIYSVMTLTYGEYGITNCHVLEETGAEYDVVYTYNEKGLLVETRAVRNSVYYNAYEYNEQGQLIKAWNDYNNYYEYTYNENGDLISTEYYEYYSWNNTSRNHQIITVEYDEQGHVLRATRAEKDCTHEAKIIYEYIYGDYYIL